MIHNWSDTPIQCVGSASISASDKPSAGSASAGPSSTRADALQSASASASPTHDAPTRITPEQRYTGRPEAAATDVACPTCFADIGDWCTLRRDPTVQSVLLHGRRWSNHRGTGPRPLDVVRERSTP